MGFHINHGLSEPTETYGSPFVPVQLPEVRAEFERFSGKIEIGTVHQVIHGTYLYRIVFEGYRSPVICTSIGTYSVLQSTVSQSYSVGTRVYVLVNSELTHGTIIGPVPSAYGQVTFAAADTVNFLSGVGCFHYWPLEYLRHFLDNKPLAAGLYDFAGRRMLDNWNGDYTVSNIFGGGFHTDPFQTFIRQSHSCGIWMFDADQLLRLIGQSIQEYSTAHERYVGVDEGEIYLFEGLALYPREALGLLGDDLTLYEKYDPPDILSSKGIGFYEPAESISDPFYRGQVFSGFVGQGKVGYWFVPPRSKNPEDFPIAVSRQQALLDGTLLFESAKGIHLVKHGNIRSFKRVRPIEDKQGDDLERGGYEFSKTPAPEPLHAGATVTDQILYAIRRQANVAFEEHKDDFDAIPEDQRAFEERDVNLASLEALKTRPEMPKAPSQQIFVDDRYEDVEYSGARASISLLDSGGIAIRGGCGEEILLQGGNITLSAPGDLRCLFGRSAVTLAGDDVVLRAKNSVDVTATDHDVRIKAERNLDMVGGMAGSGRTLLENRATTLPSLEGILPEGEAISGGGVIIKATDSVIASYGGRIYTRSVKPGKSDNSGGIIIDADNGDGSVKIRARYVGITAKTNIALGITPDSTMLQEEVPVENLLQVNRTSTSLMGRLEVDGQILSSQKVLADFGCNNGHLDPPSFDEKRLKNIKDMQESFQESNITNINEAYYYDHQMGSEEFVSMCAFSYRTSAQCGADRFSFDEPFWMELYGQSIVASLASWEEPVYSYQGTKDQTAWPGYQKWVEDKCVVPGRTRLYDAESGNDVPPTDPASDVLTPEEFYKVIGV